MFQCSFFLQPLKLFGSYLYYIFVCFGLFVSVFIRLVVQVIGQKCKRKYYVCVFVLQTIPKCIST